MGRMWWWRCVFSSHGQRQRFTVVYGQPRAMPRCSLETCWGRSVSSPFTALGLCSIGPPSLDAPCQGQLEMDMLGKPESPHRRTPGGIVSFPAPLNFNLIPFHL